MKTNKMIPTMAVALIALTYASTAMATTPKRLAPNGAGAGAFAVGDTVVISHEYTRYMTGEHIAPWVYDGKYTVLQVGSKYHPGGILVSDINSWIDPDTVERIERKPTESQQSSTPVLSSAREEKVAQSVPQPAETAPVVEEPAAPAVVEEPQPVVEEPQPAAAMPEEVQESPATTIQPEPATHEETVAEEQPETHVEVPAVENAEPAAETVAKDNGTHRFTIGVRGGYANNLSKAADAKHPFGYDAMLDLQYAHYWAKSADQCRLGLLTGVGIGYLQSGLQQSLNEQFTANTSDGDIRYTITADEVKDKAGQLQLEVPVMFSMITPGGFFLNAGPKVLLPVYTPSHQTITNPNVDAYFEEEGVHVVNEAVTGVVSESQQDLKATTANNLKVNILLGVELGYEFRLQSGYSIGLGAYANYGLWSAYRGTGDGSVFSLTAPDGAANATIDISTLTNAKATKMGYLDAGVKLTFNLDFFK